MTQRLLPVLLTPLFLWLGWPGIGFTPLLFVAFIPMLWLEDSLKDQPKAARKWFFYSWLAFGLWNFLCTWWLINAHWSGVLMTTLVNGGLMALVMSIFRFLKLKLGPQRGYIALPFLWLCLETLHKDWDLSFPWLNLGNGFANRVEWIQWYEHVGAFGGTLWIWLVNLLLFWSIRRLIKRPKIKLIWWSGSWIILLVIILPIVLSSIRYHNYKEEGAKANIVVVQPNIDTYKEKNSLTDMEQLTRFMRLANLELDDSTDFLLGPEDLLSNGFYQNQIDASEEIRLLKSTVDHFPRLNIIVGGTTLKFYQELPSSVTARPFRNGNGYYDAYNSALHINQNQKVALYHKSKRVAGAEIMPFATVIKPILGDLIESMGGTTGGLATQDTRDIFKSIDGRFRAAPLICWESDFGGYTAEYVRNGGNFLAIITNDDWWGKTPGHVQHLHYARLRAIENRRSIARSANTGISCFINQRGDLIQATEYKEQAVIKGSLNLNTKFTYYTRTGDFLSRIALFISGFLLLFAFVKTYLKRVNSQV